MDFRILNFDAFESGSSDPFGDHPLSTREDLLFHEKKKKEVYT
jgi:hypothetical protein